MLAAIGRGAEARSLRGPEGLFGLSMNRMPPGWLEETLRMSAGFAHIMDDQDHAATGKHGKSGIGEAQLN